MPRWQWKQTPMFLFGTAGLRRLRWDGSCAVQAATLTVNARNHALFACECTCPNAVVVMLYCSAAQQEGLLEGVRDVLQHSVFRFSPPWARIISGELIAPLRPRLL